MTIRLSANFDHLADLSPELHRLGILAERFLVENADTSLIKSRQFGKHTVRKIAALSGEYDASCGETPNDLLRRLATQLRLRLLSDRSSFPTSLADACTSLVWLLRRTLERDAPPAPHCVTWSSAWIYPCERMGRGCRNLDIAEWHADGGRTDCALFVALQCIPIPGSFCLRHLRSPFRGPWQTKSGIWFYSGQSITLVHWALGSRSATFSTFSIPTSTRQLCLAEYCFGEGRIRPYQQEAIAEAEDAIVAGQCNSSSRWQPA